MDVLVFRDLLWSFMSCGYSLAWLIESLRPLVYEPRSRRTPSSEGLEALDVLVFRDLLWYRVVAVPTVSHRPMETPSAKTA